MNPLYTALVQQAPGPASLLQNFLQFRNGFKGNAQQQVQQLLQSGRVSQAQYNNAVQMAQQLQQLMK